MLYKTKGGRKCRVKKVEAEEKKVVKRNDRRKAVNH